MKCPTARGAVGVRGRRQTDAGSCKMPAGGGGIHRIAYRAALDDRGALHQKEWFALRHVSRFQSQFAGKSRVFQFKCRQQSIPWENPVRPTGKMVLIKVCNSSAGKPRAKDSWLAGLGRIEIQYRTNQPIQQILALYLVWRSNFWVLTWQRILFAIYKDTYWGSLDTDTLSCIWFVDPNFQYRF